MIAYPELETAICSATQERLNPTGFNAVLTCSVPSSEPVSLLDSQKIPQMRSSGPATIPSRWKQAPAGDVATVRRIRIRSRFKNRHWCLTTFVFFGV